MELLFFGCLICLCVLLGINESQHKKSEGVLTDAIASAATKCAELEKRLNELEEKFNELSETAVGVDAAEFEKRWQDGVQSIMNYSLAAAMGGNLNE